ncbi:MAG TPA: M56 family metallopeptidase [Longimicrobiales bacterium]|nr:M56 family metallopeptidase [Longimicrobiales bacterium]
MTELLVFLATYALHSTILALLAIAVASRVRDDAWREAIYRTALVGGVCTAAFVTLQPSSLPFPRWTIDAVPLAGADDVRGSSAGAADAVPAGVAGTTADRDVGGAVHGSTAHPIALVVAGAWAGIALLLLAQMAAARVGLRRKLANRERLRSGPTWERMRELAAASGLKPVRLSIVRYDGSPFAIWPAEICLPEWFPDLEAHHQSAALAHELAHVRRGDALWQLGGGLIECVFFFQPLNRLLRLRLQTLAEQLCDDDAVRHLPDPLDLARCLTTVAERMTPARIPAPAMIGRRYGLAARVERIARWRNAALPRRHVLLAGAIVSLAAFVLLAPAVRATPGATFESGTGAYSSDIRDGEARRDRVVTACSSEWTRVWSVNRQGVIELGRELARMEPRSGFILVEGRLLTADQMRAWRALDIREGDALLSEVVIYRPSGDAAASVGLSERGVMCMYTRSGVELPAGLGGGQ